MNRSVRTPPCETGSMTTERVLQACPLRPSPRRHLRPVQMMMMMMMMMAGGDSDGWEFTSRGLFTPHTNSNGGVSSPTII